jgi:hypothetical protein
MIEDDRGRVAEGFFRRREEFVRHGIPHAVHVRHMKEARRLRAEAVRTLLSGLASSVLGLARRPKAPHVSRGS